MNERRDTATGAASEVSSLHDGLESLDRRLRELQREIASAAGRPEDARLSVVVPQRAEPDVTRAPANEIAAAGQPGSDFGELRARVDELVQLRDFLRREIADFALEYRDAVSVAAPPDAEPLAAQPRDRRRTVRELGGRPPARPQPLRIGRVGAVAVLTLDRPAKRNALSIELRELLATAVAELEADDEIAVAVLTGEGSAFCSGMDSSQFGGDGEHRRRLADASVAALGAVARFHKPLIAAVNGPAVAGGFVLALHADLRLAAPTARFGFPELPAGIPPSYAAALSGVPEPLARDLVLTGRMLDAEEALAAGLVRELVAGDQLVPRALELATEIAARPRAALIEVKRRILLAAEHARGPLVADEERVLRAALLGGDTPAQP